MCTETAGHRLSADSGGSGQGPWGRGPRIVLVTPHAPPETFVQAHIDRLPAEVVLVHGWPPRMEGREIVSWPQRALHKAWRVMSRTEVDGATAAYEKVFRRYRPRAVLAEYGTAGVLVAAACRRAGVPLIVHFHGFDASIRDVLTSNADTYPRLFHQAA